MSNTFITRHTSAFKTLLRAQDTEETVCLMCFEAMVIGNKFSCDVSQDHQTVLFFPRINTELYLKPLT